MHEGSALRSDHSHAPILRRWPAAAAAGGAATAPSANAEAACIVLESISRRVSFIRIF